jgi:hypothetical protein
MVEPALNAVIRLNGDMRCEEGDSISIDLVEEGIVGC